MPELKVTPRHLEHDAYLYVRQSTPRQVLENTESTQTPSMPCVIARSHWVGR